MTELYSLSQFFHSIGNDIQRFLSNTSPFVIIYEKAPGRITFEATRDEFAKKFEELKKCYQRTTADIKVFDLLMEITPFYKDWVSVKISIEDGLKRIMAFVNKAAVSFERMTETNFGENIPDIIANFKSITPICETILAPAAELRGRLIKEGYYYRTYNEKLIPVVKILFAGRYSEACNSFKDILERRSFVTRFADTGDKVIEIVAREKPDIVCLDAGLAGEVTGMDALKKIREISPHIRVIMTAASPAGETRELLKKHGLTAEYYLQGPVEPGKIRDLVYKLLPYAKPTV